MRALTKAFRRGTTKKQYCAIGSLKSNVGHLDAAAGAAGLVKVALALEHKQIPASLNYESPNPNIDFANSPFFVNSQLKNWHVDEGKLWAGVSSFGLGGTNAHVVVEEAPPTQASGASRPRHLFVLSAASATALSQVCQNLSEHLADNPHVPSADVAFTLQVGRAALTHRRVLIGNDLQEISSQLTQRESGFSAVLPPNSPQPSVVFMFPGQGSQYVGMSQPLYENEPVFRRWLDRCCDLLQGNLGLDLRSVLFPDSKGCQQAELRLQQTDVSLCAIFAVNYSLAQLWMAWGVRPAAMIGHSIGEYVAAAVADVMTLEDALRLVALRGALIESLPSGKMLAVAMPVEQLQPLLNAELDLAAINGPEMCIVSGHAEPIGRLKSALEAEGIDCRDVRSRHAGHCAIMDPIRQPLVEAFQQVSLKPPQIPYLSNVTGTWIREDQATDPAYWGSHIRQTVKFSQGVGEILENRDSTLLEVGAGNSLSRMVKLQLIGQGHRRILGSLPHPKDAETGDQTTLTALAQLWLCGVQIDWAGLYQEQRRQRVPLPTYPFERRRFWIEQPARPDTAPTQLVGRNRDETVTATVWRESLSVVQRGGKADGQATYWLLFADLDDEIGARLEERLANGSQPIVVRRGAEFAQLGPREFALRPSRSQDFLRLLEQLGVPEEVPMRVVHLWGISSTSPGSLPDRIHDSQVDGLQSPLLLAEALAACRPHGAHSILLFSQATQRVLDEPVGRPEEATILGARQVIRRDWPRLNCRNIDIAFDATRNGIDETLVDTLVDEIHFDDASSVVAYRNGRRWTQQTEPLAWERDEADQGVSLAPGTYVLIGDRRGPLQELAQAIARQPAAKVCWIERTSSGQTDISEHATAGSGADHDTTTNEGIQTLPSDPSNLEQMQQAIDTIETADGTIRGVVYDAGGAALDAGSSRGASRRLDTQLMEGFVVDTLFRERPLDFLVYCSSAAAGEPGCGSRTEAVGSLLGALARAGETELPGRVLHVDWSGWHAVDEDPSTEGEARLYALFSTILRRFHGAEVRLENAAKTAAQSGGSGTSNDRLEAETAMASSYARPDLMEPYVAPNSSLERDIAGIWQEILGIDKVGVNDSFFALGGDSLAGVQVIHMIKRRLKKDVIAALLYEHPTVGSLAKSLSDEAEEAPSLSARRNRGDRRRAASSRNRSRKKPHE